MDHPPIVKYYAQSDTGLVKLTNEDSWQVLELDHIFCFILADGMGSKMGGAIASQIAVKTAEKIIKESLQGNQLSEKIILECMKNTIEKVNGEIRKEMKERNLPQMGTTIIMLFVWNQNVYIANVGDSRAYQLKNRISLVQITKDHAISPASSTLKYSSDSDNNQTGCTSLLTRGCGMAEDIKVDIFSISVKLEKGVFLICSDGLCNMLNDSEIETVLKADLPMRQKVELYIQLAKESGGEDNITAIVVEC